MVDVVKTFLELLQLERINDVLFRGANMDMGIGTIYGGQLLAQALSAATQTVSDDRGAHSLHAYFVHPGTLNDPVDYRVDTINDGKRFTLKKVTAAQKDKTIFFMNVSFHISEAGFEHQLSIPDVPGPEAVTSAIELFRAVKNIIPEPVREQLTRDQPIDFKPINPMNPFAPEKKDPVFNIWFKAADALPDDKSIHKCMLAFASDWGILSASLNPHSRSVWEPAIQIASLDHAIWFHRDFRMDEWMLHFIESPNAGSGRVLNKGSIFTQDGKLAASMTQEGLIRHMV
jgi:acyl-CoA thioesterase II